MDQQEDRLLGRESRTNCAFSRVDEQELRCFRIQTDKQIYRRLPGKRSIGSMTLKSGKGALSSDWVCPTFPGMYVLQNWNCRRPQNIEARRLPEENEIMFTEMWESELSWNSWKLMGNYISKLISTRKLKWCVRSIWTSFIFYEISLQISDSKIKFLTKTHFFRKITMSKNLGNADFG